MHRAPREPYTTVGDGDLCESTMDALVSLYDKVSYEGFINIDEYGVFPNCRAAVDEFRCGRGIYDRINAIDGSGIFWQRGKV